MGHVNGPFIIRSTNIQSVILIDLACFEFLRLRWKLKMGRNQIARKPQTLEPVEESEFIGRESEINFTSQCCNSSSSLQVHRSIWEVCMKQLPANLNVIALHIHRARIFPQFGTVINEKCSAE